VSARPEAERGAHVAPEAEVADDVSIGPGAVIHEGASVGARSKIGSCAVIHANVRVGEDCVIEEGAVLGKKPRLRAGSSAAGGELGTLVLEAGVTVCCGAVVYAGATVGSASIIGDQTQVREGAVIGPASVLGRGSSVEFGVRIGTRALIQTDVYLTAGTLVEDDVFLGPGVLTTNDDTMGRHPRDDSLRGAVFRRACRVGGGVVLVPGVVIGEEAFVAAGAVVTRDVGERQVVMGCPARVVRDVPDEDLIEHWRATGHERM
jgi:UDP-3-O-[3-hydroxymyristoyl] glucosamine N-acyltransferase